MGGLGSVAELHNLNLTMILLTITKPLSASKSVEIGKEQAKKLSHKLRE